MTVISEQRLAEEGGVVEAFNYVSTSPQFSANIWSLVLLVCGVITGLKCLSPVQFHYSVS